jgi:hypothetical protein
MERAVDDPFSVPAGAWLSKRGYEYYRNMRDFSSARSSSSGLAERTSEARTIDLGEPVDGSKVTGLSISPTSLLDESSAVLQIELGAGQNGLYLVTVPEPATMLGIGAIAAAILRRGGRRG